MARVLQGGPALPAVIMAKNQCRVFLGIPLTEQLKDELQQATNRLKLLFNGEQINWSRPENLHLTLHFFGDIQNDKM